MTAMGSNLVDLVVTFCCELIRGQRKIVICLALIVIVFFKPLVIRAYPLIGPFFLALGWFSILMGVAYLLFESPRERNDIIFKIAFLIASPGIGVLSRYLVDSICGLPDTLELIDQISHTSRLSWIPIMFQWDNMAPSFYFIAYFVSMVYLAGCFLTSGAYLNANRVDLINPVLLRDSFRQSLLMVVLVRSNLAYWLLFWSLSLLE